MSAGGEVRDITIIGAGPTGLATAFWAGMREASCRIVDALPEVGGQLTALYPEKPIYDVPGRPRVLARELVEQLSEQALEPFDVPLHLATTAESISREGGELVVHCADGALRSRAVIVAAGHGAIVPRRLPEAQDVPWAQYLVSDKRALAGKRVVIVGGGDSALDWTLELAGVARHVTLVHRRERFRAHELTVSRVRRAAADGRVDLAVPYVLGEAVGNGGLERVVLRPARGDPGAPVREIAADALLLQLGFRADLGPLRAWGLALERQSIVVSATMATSMERVWACGDVTAHDGKLKLIATGFSEAATAVGQAVTAIRPGTVLQPGYSTDTGIPGRP
jgi:ferredoxin/flavodoxin---NADP+ reductase